MGMGDIAAGIRGFAQGMQLEKQFDPEGFDNNYGTKSDYEVPQFDPATGQTSYKKMKMTARQYKIKSQNAVQQSNMYKDNLQNSLNQQTLNKKEGQDAFSSIAITGNTLEFNKWNEKHGNKFGGNLEFVNDDILKNKQNDPKFQTKYEQLQQTIAKDNIANKKLGLKQDRIVMFKDGNGQEQMARLSDVALSMGMSDYVKEQQVRQNYFSDLAKTENKKDFEQTKQDLVTQGKLKVEDTKFNNDVKLENVKQTNRVELQNNKPAPKSDEQKLKYEEKKLKLKSEIEANQGKQLTKEQSVASSYVAKNAPTKIEDLANLSDEQIQNLDTNIRTANGTKGMPQTEKTKRINAVKTKIDTRNKVADLIEQIKKVDTKQIGISTDSAWLAVKKMFSGQTLSKSEKEYVKANSQTDMLRMAYQKLTTGLSGSAKELEGIKKTFGSIDFLSNKDTAIATLEATLTDFDKNSKEAILGLVTVNPAMAKKYAKELGSSSTNGTEAPTTNSKPEYGASKDPKVNSAVNSALGW